MIVRPSNSLVRWISARVVKTSEKLEENLPPECKDAHDKFWDSAGNYRAGGDWLTGTAFEMLFAPEDSSSDVDHGGSRIRQFEIGRSDVLSCLPSAEGLRLAGRDGKRHRFNSAIAVEVRKVGLVLTDTPVVLVWMDVRLDSENSEAWSEFFAAIQKRSDATYLHHFLDRHDSPRSLNYLMEDAEKFCLRSVADSMCAGGRTFQRFARFDLEGGKGVEVEKFIGQLRGGADAVDESRTVPSTDVLPTRWHCGSETVFSVRWSRENSGIRNPRFHNAFQLPDIWLGCALAMAMSCLLNRLEQLLLRTSEEMSGLRGNNPLRIAADLLGVLHLQKRYESIMDLHVNAVCILDPGRLHTHAGRDSTYQKIRDGFQIDQRHIRIEEQMKRLRFYLSEKRQRLFGWFLKFFPFLTLFLGVLAINVRDVTSGEGITWAQLGSWILFGTFFYGFLLWFTSFVLRVKSRTTPTVKNVR